MSDSGGALLLQAEEAEEARGVLSIEMTAHSKLWEVGTLGTGGSRATRDIEATYFSMDGAALFQAFKTIGAEMLYQKVQQQGLDWNQFSAIGMHQVAHLYNDMLIEELDLPRERTLLTVEDYGNVASNSLPLQLEQALQSGRVHEGDLFAFIGLGGGISTGLGIFKL
jgi:3-oxoacyl-[acyl-carrier-protein] synthase-3